MVSTPIPDATGGFVQTLFAVQLTTGANNPTGDFTSWSDVLGYSTLDDSAPFSTAINVPTHSPAMASILSEIGDGWKALPEFYSRGKCRDTSLGGNDAINCYPQFCENDDVSDHPFLAVPGQPNSGMGRVYSEIYDDQQQIMYITFGVPKYNNLENFYSNAVLADLARIVTTGKNVTASGLGQLVGVSIATAIKMPSIPLVWIARAFGSGWQNVQISKYYEFQSAMPLYYRCVNSMIQHLCINMGLNIDNVITPNGAGIGGDGTATATMQQQQAGNLLNANGSIGPGLPEIFQHGSPDIYRILLKRHKYNVANPPDLTNTQTSDDALIQSTADATTDPAATSGNYLTDFFSMFTGQLYGESLYLGFKIEKGVDTSETFTSETGPSDIAQQINSQLASAREKKFEIANGNISGGGLIQSAMEGIKSALTSASTYFSANAVDNVLAGNGVIDFPDIWKSSSFSKSYTFNMSLRTPYGDSHSILYNNYIPLCMILAGAMPRAIGQSAYTSPFVCRAYCRGMFAVPLGIISHLTVKRGADQYGWSTQRLPTCIDLSFEIKDLSPAMYLAIADGGEWQALQQVFNANSPFQEYLMTLSGMGLLERLSWIRNMRRKAAYLVSNGKLDTFLNPAYLAASFGNMLPARMLSTFLPSTRLPNN